MNTMQHPHDRTPAPRFVLGFEQLGFGVLFYAYAVLLGACYLFAFWRPIGFNIFPYLGLQDYVSAPLNRVVVLVATPLLASIPFFSLGHAPDNWERRTVALCLSLIFIGACITELSLAASVHLKLGFYFRNEISIAILVMISFALGTGIAIYAYRTKAGIHIQIAGLILVQCATAMTAGYRDGKTIYNGAAETHFLANSEICDASHTQDWVFLGAFGGQTFFMGAIDKRLCLTDEKNLQLISRKVKESL